MADRFDEVEWRLDCLNSRMDALDAPRADAVASKSGTVSVDASVELDLGRLGFGEVEYAVSVSYKVELVVRGVTGGDWSIEDMSGKHITVPRGKWPVQAIDRAVEKDLAKRKADLVGEALRRL